MASIHATSNEHVPANTSSKLLRTGAGKVHAIYVSTSASSAESLILYDNTAAAGAVLAAVNVIDSAPVALNFRFPLTFSTGLTAVSGTNTSANLILEY